MTTAADGNLELRELAVEAIAAGRPREAARRLSELWTVCPSPASAQFIVARFQELQGALPLQAVRIHIERSFTVEPVIPVLRAKGYLHGFDLEVRVGGFDAVASEMLDAGSPLYARPNDVAIVAVQTRSIAPDLWNTFTSLSPGEIDAAVERVSGQMRAWIRAFRANSSAHLIVHLLDTPVYPADGLLNSAAARASHPPAAAGQADTIARINTALREIAADTPGVHLLDYDDLTARHGRAAWEDPVRWATLRMPLATQSIEPLADEWLRYLHPITGRVAKVLVCDLDNTLWGGVLGEDGQDGIRVGGDYPGSAFLALQRAILDLNQRGILLAISSKNDHADAMAAIEKHPGMILRPEHFAALRINWIDKATSLREIAAELNVGTDALAFLDDNPHEREWIRSQMPEVFVIDLPTEPALYEQTLRRQPCLERLAVTDEDLRRGTMYAEQRQRQELQSTCADLEEYYRSLDLVVEVEPAAAPTLERAAQLIGKTNQFNLTGKRMSLAELELLSRSDDALVLTARVRDRFGDSGIVGVVVGRILEPQRCRIDVFVMSCRVIGRTVETAILSALGDLAASRGVRRLEGRFVPTARNAPAREVYAGHGFALLGEHGGASDWQIDLYERPIACPPWIRLAIPQEAGR